MVEKSLVTAIDEIIPFEVETDASEVALVANVGKPVAFFSPSLQGSVLNHAAIERIAKAIVAAVRRWEQFLTGRHFTLKTDQTIVSYMFNQRLKAKIKNDKITIHKWLPIHYFLSLCKLAYQASLSCTKLKRILVVM